MKSFKCLAMIVIMVFGASSAVQAASYNEIVKGLDEKPGLLPVFLDHNSGKVYWLLPAPDENGHLGRYIYAIGLTGGLGSNPVGLDRGRGGGTSILRMRNVGGKILFEAENLSHRARPGNPGEERAVAHSFATSVLWSGGIAARDDRGRLLVDVTSFLIRDAMNTATQLASRNQGNYRFDRDRSVVDTRAALTFPKNLEFDVLITFGGDRPGSEVRRVTPEPEAVTLTLHHSLIELPDDGYRLRFADPRTAAIAVSYEDYSAPLTDDMTMRLARRFRLQKTDPHADVSSVKEPLIFYVDNGAPEPIRSALVEGVSWWAEAFEAAGFKDAFRVELLPEDAHPMDVRYNIVQWVHRAQRGWSTGGGIYDPRTGEMIKAMVVLGSRRIRQDIMIFEGLMGTENSGKGGANDPVEIALARIRQLGAHEVGHTLGFQHNMAASTQFGRASVMDYPGPVFTVTADGKIDGSNAYGVGMGEWDKFSVNHLYREFAPGVDEQTALDAIVEEAVARGLRYVADSHSRPADAAHPLGNLWDSGEEPLASLNLTMELRRIALDNFGAAVLAEGRQLSDLHEKLVPIYLFHRYQLEAATKVIGGVNFSYSLKGDAQGGVQTLDPAYQRQALSAVLATLNPVVLDLDDALLEQMAPRLQRGGEVFENRSTPAFDVLAAAETAAAMTLDGLLHPARAARLVEFHRRDSANPSLEEVLQATGDQLFASPRSENARHLDIRRVVQERFIASVIDLAGSSRAGAAVRSRATAYLNKLANDLFKGAPAAERPHRQYLIAQIERFLTRSAAPVASTEEAAEAPPGAPIGMGEWEDLCWLCLPQ